MFSPLKYLQGMSSDMDTKVHIKFLLTRTITKQIFNALKEAVPKWRSFQNCSGAQGILKGSLPIVNLQKSTASRFNDVTTVLSAICSCLILCQSH